MSRSAARPSVTQEPDSQPRDAVEAQPTQDKTSGESAMVRTRSGRTVKPPNRYVPVEVCDDDYGDEDYDSTDISDVSSEMSLDSEEISSESDADDQGNLDGFVTEDKSDDSGSESYVSGSESESGNVPGSRGGKARK